MIKPKLICGVLAIAIASTTLVSCNKDKDEPQVQEVIKDLSVETQAVALVIGENSEVTISDGNGTYTITSADESIAVASISDNKVKIEAKKDGETFLTLKDAKGKEQRISVKVFKTLGVAESQVTLKIRNEKQIDIAGNGEFEASVDNTNASAEIQGDKVKITATEVGTSVVTIKDKKSGKATTINVTVEDYPVVSVSNAAITLLLGATSEVTISGGAEQTYTATADNNNVVVEVEGEKVLIEAVAVGTSVVTVKDEKAQKTATISVTVQTPPVELSRNSVEFNRFQTESLIIDSSLGQEDSYTYSANGYDTNIVEITFRHENSLGPRNNQTGWAINIKSKGVVGTTTPTIKDNQTGNIKTLQIKVKAPALNITGPQGSNPITIHNVGGINEQAGVQGSGNYIIATNPTGIVSVEKVSANGGDKLKIKALSTGEAIITIQDGTQTKTLKVIVPVPVSTNFEIESGILKKITNISDDTTIIIPATVTTIGEGAAIIESSDRIKVKKIVIKGATEIKPFAFQGLKNLEEVIIESNVTTIGMLAFSIADNLKKVTFKAITPPSITANMINGRGKKENRILIVPPGSKSQYEANSHFTSLFGTITEE